MAKSGNRTFVEYEITTAKPPRSSSTRISTKQATEIALKVIPGKNPSVAIERKLGKNVYVVEILEKGTGAEVDVLVDMVTGKVLGTDR